MHRQQGQPSALTVAPAVGDPRLAMAQAYVAAGERELDALALVAAGGERAVSGKGRAARDPALAGLGELDHVWWADGREAEPVTE